MPINQEYQERRDERGTNEARRLLERAREDGQSRTISFVELLRRLTTNLPPDDIPTLFPKAEPAGTSIPQTPCASD